jgi:hypothetical protein
VLPDHLPAQFFTVLLACRNAWSFTAAATAPEQLPLPAAPRHCLSPAALVRVQARDSCPAGGRATRASTSAWMVGRCQPVWTVTAGLEGMTWRSAGRRLPAGCSDCRAVWLSPPPWRPGTSQQLSASERYPPALLLSFPLSFWCAQGRNASVELRCRSPRQLLRSFQRADGFPDPWPVFITRPRCSCRPQPVVYPHPSRPLFLPVEAVVSWVR